MYIIELITIVLFFIIGMTYNKGFKINNKLEENIRVYEKEKKENR
jgi:low affinity Fe/Cu permease|tara:strand:+ start:573 stop:707 length:135 start_codon:yes stop_codon:yes gene_type:complete